MAWGIETSGVFGRLPIDDNYQNLVVRNQGSVSLSAGYRTVTFESGGISGLVAAVRHPGMQVSLLGYITDSNGTRGVRLHVKGSGRFYWRTYEPGYPLPLTGWGMVVYNAAGEQTFHSDHKYADLVASRHASSGNYSLGGNYYFLVAPSSPDFHFESEEVMTGTAPVYDYYYEYQWVTERRYACGNVWKYTCERERVYVCGSQYVYGQGYVYTCGYEYQNVCKNRQVYECNWVSERVWKRVRVHGLVGHWWYYEQTVYMTKTTYYIEHLSNNVIRPRQYTATSAVATSTGRQYQAGAQAPGYYPKPDWWFANPTGYIGMYSGVGGDTLVVAK